jgi:hypothetical protein
MSKALPRVALALLLMPACSEPAAPPAPPRAAVELSSDNPDSNAPAVAAFFRRTCLDASADSSAFTAALRAAGWAHEQIQAASSAMPIAAWRLDHGELVRSEVSLGPGANFVDCQLTLDVAVAPSLARMRDAIRPVIRHASLREIGGREPEMKWQWRPGPRQERDLTIGPAPSGASRGGRAGRTGLTIHFASSEAPAPPPIREANENENENVQ